MTGIFPVDSSAMDRYYGPSLTLTCVKEENEELQEDLDEDVLHQNIDDDTSKEYSIDMPNEAQTVVQDSLVWPCDDSNPVTLRANDFESLSKGQCLTDTTVDFYLKYQERKHQYMKPGLYFFSSFFFRKLVIILKEDVKNGFKKITRWFKGINIFKCDYIFLPILLRYSIYVL